jgi:hypothetical protein
MVGEEEQEVLLRIIVWLDDDDDDVQYGTVLYSTAVPEYALGVLEN